MMWLFCFFSLSYTRYTPTLTFLLRLYYSCFLYMPLDWARPGGGQCGSLSSLLFHYVVFRVCILLIVYMIDDDAMP
jgi:hypothetical protein